ncbi:hypothetical protein GCM10023186_32590 [Hymenobacter koreensis]|uniref:Uncharacterized protein n=1 Tax=Hymenobacter koreensis TaxID=1084523 RepID=A0ABP8J961_9BACT
MPKKVYTGCLTFTYAISKDVAAPNRAEGMSSLALAIAVIKNKNGANIFVEI